MYISQKKKKTTKNNDENDQISLMFGIPRLIQEKPFLKSIQK